MLLCNATHGAKCEVRSAKCEVRSAKCEVRSAKCEVRSAKCEVGDFMAVCASISYRGVTVIQSACLVIMDAI